MVNKHTKTDRTMKQYRDSRGRFAKQPQPTEENQEHRILRSLNRLADGGHEESIDDVRRNEAIARISLRVLFFIFLSFLLWIFTSCGSSRPVQTVTVERVHRETVTLRDTILQVKLIPQRDSITTPDTTSTLRNRYCESSATVSQGQLTHTLATLPNSTQEVPVQIREVVRTDSIPYPVPGPTVYVEKSLSTMQRILQTIGVITIGILTLMAVRLIRRTFFV